MAYASYDPLTYAYYPVMISIKLAAIGGPLSTGVSPGFGSAGQVPQHDTYDSSKPLYLQYFGYTYVDDESKPDPLLQTPQTGTASASGPTDGTMEYEWSVAGNATITSDIDPSRPSATISATNSSGIGTIRVKCHFTYDDGEISGEADDDTDEMPDALSHRFTSHMPSTLKEIESSSISANSQVVSVPSGMLPVSNQFPNDYLAVLQLKDHLGQGMNGVFVQERFPNLATEVKGHYDPVAQQYDHPNSVPGDESVNDEFNYWISFRNTLDDPPIDGVLGGINGADFELKPDQISLDSTYDTDTTSGGTWSWQTHAYPYVALTQNYVAGTSNPAPGTYGIDVGTWTIKKWTDRITHTIQP